MKERLNRIIPYITRWSFITYFVLLFYKLYVEVKYELKKDICFKKWTLNDEDQ